MPAPVNYTECLTLLMADIVDRVSTLSFIDVADVLVFARPGRSNASGPLATCHCLTLPPSEPGYYFWRDRASGKLTRRSQWFIRKSPVVTVGSRQIKYLFSFALPRFCDQSLTGSRKQHLYPRAEPWIAKLDTVIHELYHIDPEHQGLRPIERGDGTYSARCHDQQFFAHVAEMTAAYLRTQPDPGVYDFLRHDFDQLMRCHGGVVSTAFRGFPSFPQRYPEPAPVQPTCEEDSEIVIEPIVRRAPTHYTEDDLQVRQFFKVSSRQVPRVA
ncbi:MAG: hypothetical protein C5B57_06470 [Blastocatellia bacterium]|nr:MAG: hypothetical protein C5B57_06470 [Blastocatellia bacterium]